MCICERKTSWDSNPGPFKFHVTALTTEVYCQEKELEPLGIVAENNIVWPARPIPPLPFYMLRLL